MTYRDQARACPRCQLAVEQLGDRAKWRCKACVGALVGLDELAGELDVDKLVPRTASEDALACPLCGMSMQPVEIGGVPLDRCEADRVVWFDAGELGRMRTRLEAGDPDEHARKVALFESMLRRLI
jgi:hypothetical protein